MAKLIVLILLFFWLNTSIAYSVDCTREVCLKVPWPKECDKFCAGTAIQNARYPELREIFKFDRSLADKIINAREDKSLMGKTLFEKLESRLNDRELGIVNDAIQRLSPQDQAEIIRRGLINSSVR